jgi:hypothetical protein
VKVLFVAINWSVLDPNHTKMQKQDMNKVLIFFLLIGTASWELIAVYCRDLHFQIVLGVVQLAAIDLV